MKKLVKISTGLIVIAACLAVGVFATEYLLSTQGTAREAGSQGEPRTVRVGVTSPERRELETAVSAVGTITPVRTVEIAPATSGRVVAVPIASSARVERGDLLLQLDAGAEQAELDSAQATLEEARQNFERIEELAEANAAAEQQLEQARAALARARADFMAAEAALADRRVEAPFSGTLGFVDIEPGAYLSPSTPVTRLSDLSAVQVDLSLPEMYFARVEPGQLVELTVPAYPGETFRGEVTVRDSAVDQSSRSFAVRAEVENADRRLVGGMFAQSRLVFDTYSGLAIPDDAIISEGTSTYVFTVADDQARRTDVSLGGSVGSLTEVTDGLAAEDRVVVTGWDTLRDGSAVEIDDTVPQEGLE